MTFCIDDKKCLHSGPARFFIVAHCDSFYVAHGFQWGSARSSVDEGNPAETASNVPRLKFRNLPFGNSAISCLLIEQDMKRSDR